MSLLQKSGSTMVGSIVKALLSYSSEKTELPFIISPGLDYQESQESLRSVLNENVRHVKKPSDVSDAFVAWNRSALTWDESTRLTGDTDECNFLGKGAFGQFEMNFKLFSSSMNLLEQFEVAYVTRTLFTDITGIKVDFSGCNGECSLWYELDWQDLSSLELNKEDNHYSSLEFSVTINGSFMSMLNDADKIKAESERPKPILEIVFDTIIENTSRNYL